ncbi:leucyl aminopeptidase [Hasllibacter halocynthiae]|uniref:Leucyl aminopeptidase n=1 Tax=Hasllibacter halocynthiae TaxID=595589 RepID=A0A2T0X317_9RHOB|nr:leucyl aminopeptidase family protein [Hasllibacter halocynthiae]PRY93343.1 leucyl aminopeptidase [Hasllibacter halocynthiae]
MTARFAESGGGARPLHVVTPEGLPAFLTLLDPPARAFAEGAEFAAGPGEVLLLPDASGAVAAAAVGLGGAEARARRRFTAAAALARLPEGVWQIASGLDPEDAAEAALGMLMAARRFDRYADAAAPKARIARPEGVDAARIEAVAAGEALIRDLIDTPAMDMGPADLEAAARAVAEGFGATVEVTSGAALEEGFPLIHAVGMAAGPGRGPRLIDMAWGDGPALTLVGKGVCFDTGGLNLKSGASMGLMKKDMGGAAHVLGLARTIMALELPLKLRVLIPAVENAVSGPAFRPGDILRSRKGPSVEVNNTDAEGRLVLADALALAAEGEPGLTVSFATLTGAARVAVGPDIAPFFTGEEGLARALPEAAAKVRDPVWRMPFHEPYETLIEPGIADLDNAPKGGFAGAITAALFLRRFAPPRYAHLDVYGWNPTAAPARPKGGAGSGWRALLDCLPGVL